mmetsp:Transcript_82385/g.236727  ORF Transcript_82385/g.236727 Transcript_82385/m.236727 type:complete len:415 (+) Transcript_82385:31-1275(+)
MVRCQAAPRSHAQERARFRVVLLACAVGTTAVMLPSALVARSFVFGAKSLHEARKLTTWQTHGTGLLARPALGDLSGSHLKSLAEVTTLSIDTGDLDVIKDWAATGLISDATTNPLFVSQAGMSGDPRYVAFVGEAIAYAKKHGADLVEEDRINLAIDRLSVNLGREIAGLVPGYISTEVDIRESFDINESVRRARRIIAMYEELGVPRSRVLIKLAATWEGIKAAEILEQEGITCNLTLVFGFAQAVACAQAKVRLISPFPGRILDWHKLNGGQPTYEPTEDPGVVTVRRIYNYYKKYGHEGTICMPASWRPSRGKGYDTDELVALAGVDRMTIGPPLLEKLAATKEPLPRLLTPEAAAASCEDDEVCGGAITEKDFRMLMTADECATSKLAEGINSFVSETEKLRAALLSKL